MAYINFGSNTERVKNLQEMLRTLANLTGKAEYNVAADGNFDAATRRAVSDFQREHGLTVTGVPDNATWDILRREVYAAKRESGEGLPSDPAGKLLLAVLIYDAAKLKLRVRPSESWV